MAHRCMLSLFGALEMLIKVVSTEPGGVWFCPLPSTHPLTAYYKGQKVLTAYYPGLSMWHV